MAVNDWRSALLVIRRNAAETRARQGELAAQIETNTAAIKAQTEAINKLLIRVAKIEAVPSVKAHL